MGPNMHAPATMTKSSAFLVKVRPRSMYDRSSLMLQHLTRRLFGSRTSTYGSDLSLFSSSVIPLVVVLDPPEKRLPPAEVQSLEGLRGL